MKKLQLALAALLLSGACALPASPASAASKPITVQIDQKALSFGDLTPVQQEGTVLVPMRALFQKYGAQASLDAKTGVITGAKNGLRIQLQLGSKRATINGQAVQLSLAPQKINGTVYVPLRLIGEAFGCSVAWNAKSGMVSITSPADPSGIKTLLSQYVEYSNTENLEGFMSLFTSDSPLNVPAVRSQIQAALAASDMKTAVEQASILKLQGNDAIVQTVESTSHISGPYEPDQRSSNTYHLIYAKDNWRIRDVTINGVQYLLSDAQRNVQLTVPAEDAEAVQTVLKNYYDYAAKKQADALFGLFEKEPQASEQAGYTQAFQNYDLAYTVENSRIIAYSGKECALLFNVAIRKVKGSDYKDNRNEIVFRMVKNADGQWKIGGTFVIGSTPLNP
ncbi:copper amine oxidase N-terminal domain-containing protein [Paenibacillus spiritus]|uniref:Copper amine oxidase N-terminal domain-containing protein n=1 Tax=Paenibacillus spiritus TaxID=2496557 RepID=A0A5J5FXU1_9BACL|nr:copper amine oxidase N-terminal domain-containing protein [Paenibacillus spiritus]KAA8997934.1 copper amine oxidase N-terminal domain-containing protein [Paenibacillus spiritus]